MGRSIEVDKSIEEGEKLEKLAKDMGAKHYYILIEKAIKDGCNLVVAPNGICGNLIFRSLVLVGSAKSYGAISLGIDPIFIDTSRSQTVEGYMRALKFAKYLATKFKKEGQCH